MLKLATKFSTASPVHEPAWPGSPRAYDWLKACCAASLSRNWRVDGHGLDRLRSFRTGIIAVNHGHIVDGTVVAPLVDARVLFLCDARAVDAPILGHILRAAGVLRVDVTRSDPGAALAALRAAADGHLLGIFPEGRVRGARGMMPARAGVAHLASALGLPVLPVSMWGLDAFNRPLDVYVKRIRPTIDIRVGEPQFVAVGDGDRVPLRAAADAIMTLIADKLPVSLQGVYAPGTARRTRGREALDAGWLRPAAT